MSKSINTKSVKLDWLDVQDLAAHVLGLDPDDYDDDVIEDKLTEKFFEMEDGPLGAFQKIVEHLIPTVDIGESPLTGIYYKGFTRDFGNNKKTWLVKSIIEMPKNDQDEHTRN